MIGPKWQRYLMHGRLVSMPQIFLRSEVGDLLGWTPPKKWRFCRLRPAGRRVDLLRTSSWSMDKNMESSSEMSIMKKIISNHVYYSEKDQFITCIFCWKQAFVQVVLLSQKIGARRGIVNFGFVQDAVAASEESENFPWRNQLPEKEWCFWRCGDGSKPTIPYIFPLIIFRVICGDCRYYTIFGVFTPLIIFFGAQRVTGFWLSQIYGG